MIDRESAKRCVGPGWHKLIDEFYDEFPDAAMIQVKEKYGRLCLYHRNETDASMIKELELMKRSSEMCEECGEPTKTRDIRGWQWTLCDKHAEEKMNLQPLNANRFYSQAFVDARTDEEKKNEPPYTITTTADPVDYKYVVYATGDHGDGHVQKLGEYDEIDDISIHVGMFSKDVVIAIERQKVDFLGNKF